jgi:hypothetical protein
MPTERCAPGTGPADAAQGAGQAAVASCQLLSSGGLSPTTRSTSSTAAEQRCTADRKALSPRVMRNESASTSSPDWPVDQAPLRSHPFPYRTTP